MNSESENSSDAFVEVAINKMEKQDKKIQEIENLLQKQIEHNAEIKQLVNAIESLQEQLQQETIADHKVSALSQQMDKLIHTLNTAPTHEVVHHHHVPKIIFWHNTAGSYSLPGMCRLVLYRKEGRQFYS